MDNIQNYKCPCCDAPLVFLGEKLNCKSCGNEFALEDIRLLSEAQGNTLNSSSYNWDAYIPRQYGEEETVSLSDYNCPSCGAQITGDAATGAVICPYCGNANIVKGRFDGSLKPDFVIPFRIDKKAAMDWFATACQKAPFLPDEFKSRKRIEEMVGVYVPFWTFDCNCEASASYRGKRVSAWSDANFNYTKEDFYKIYRSGNIGFENIPVDASKKADDAYMEALEPFNYKDAVDFNTAYLSGYFADKYDVSAEDSVKRANERVRVSTENAFAATVDGTYISVTPEGTNVSFSGGKVRYSLLPVWMLNIKYEGKNYNFAINGQTGKTVGEFPISIKKRNAYFAKAFGIAGAVAAAVATVISFI